MNQKALALLTLAIGTQAFGGPPKTISVQNFTAKIVPTDIKCRDGRPGSFPVPLTLNFRTHDGSASIHYPSTLLLQNVNNVSFWGRPSDKCSDYADVLAHKNQVDVSGSKIIAERSDFRKDYKVYQRVLREELLIQVGRLTLKGAEEFHVFPAPAADCQRPFSTGVRSRVPPSPLTSRRISRL